MDDTLTVPVAMRVPPNVKRKFRLTAERRGLSMTDLFIQWVNEYDAEKERDAAPVAS